jgi:hypothetical protein
MFIAWWSRADGCSGGVVLRPDAVFDISNKQTGGWSLRDQPSEGPS